MSKFIEVTAGTKVLINTEEIACVEPSKDYLDGSEVCVITLIHITKPVSYTHLTLPTNREV